ncbi:hypothetical protein D8884_08815 [Streptococcus sanguinis]|uniref:hypothetical protein n=1 Tax=Streptococcus sanguinis TaxID=1305 RepID=UPI000FB80BD0|nr:hypothetical protein [Streptococcus sanguinis]RSI17142.1 hypothetical protein D8884_08815 [Streptococcus sanguinis]
MLRFKNILIFICSVCLLVAGFNLYFNYQSQQEFLQLKEDFKRDNKITVLEQLMASEKYAADIRKAGYIISPDGTIRLDGGIQSLRNRRGFTFEDCVPRRERSNSFFETEFDGQ